MEGKNKISSEQKIEAVENYLSSNKSWKNGSEHMIFISLPIIIITRFILAAFLLKVPR